MSSSRYRKSRKELHALVVKSIQLQLPSGATLTQAQIDTLLSPRADDIIDTFESALPNRDPSSFWGGVWQSVVGSILVLVALGVAAFAISGYKQNPIKMVTDAVVAAPDPQADSSTEMKK